MNQIEKIIEQSKKEFENVFYEGSFYNKQTNDEQHLNLIMDNLTIKAGMKILDLGTGSGYLAFRIAKNNPEVTVIGLDIVEQALARNAERAREEKTNNIHFISYDGKVLPFDDKEFDLVVTRYVVHHFPVIENMFEEISRVLKATGKLFVSDPTPNEEDTERFVDAYMNMKKDGHIKFYTEEEFSKLAVKNGLKIVEGFNTSIRFPKKRKEAVGFDKIMKNYDKKITDGYDIEVTDDEIYITEKVNNLIFMKQ